MSSFEIVDCSVKPCLFRDRKGLYSPDTSRVFVFEVGETILEDLQNRHDRPYDDYAELLPDALRSLGVTYTNFRWNQHAGCTCSCSPGFLLHGSRGLNVFINVTRKVNRATSYTYNHLLDRKHLV